MFSNIIEFDSCSTFPNTNYNSLTDKYSYCIVNLLRFYNPNFVFPLRLRCYSASTFLISSIYSQYLSHCSYPHIPCSHWNVRTILLPYCGYTGLLYFSIRSTPNLTYYCLIESWPFYMSSLQFPYNSVIFCYPVATSDSHLHVYVLWSIFKLCDFVTLVQLLHYPFPRVIGYPVEMILLLYWNIPVTSLLRSN